MDTSSADTGSSQTMNLGFSDQRPGDADALAAAAVQLVGIGVLASRWSRPTVSISYLDRSARIPAWRAWQLKMRQRLAR